MSVGSLGIVGSLTASSIAQRSAETDRVQQDTVDQARTTQAAERTESAAGIGETEEDSQTSERDADGRRLWEQQQAKPKSEDVEALASDTRSKDPTGQAGSELDVVG